VPSHGVALEVRTVVVGWRAAMQQIRAGPTPERRQALIAVTRWTLEALDSIERAHAGEPAAVGVIRDARLQIQGAERQPTGVRQGSADAGEIDDVLRHRSQPLINDAVERIERHP
jgi:hypothetical protein